MARNRHPAVDRRRRRGAAALFMATDPDAAAFIATNGITSNIIRQAINTYVIAAKGTNGWWNSCDRIYLCVWNYATALKCIKTGLSLVAVNMTSANWSAASGFSTNGSTQYLRGDANLTSLSLFASLSNHMCFDYNSFSNTISAVHGAGDNSIANIAAYISIVTTGGGPPP